MKFRLTRISSSHAAAPRRRPGGVGSCCLPEPCSHKCAEHICLGSGSWGRVANSAPESEINGEEFNREQTTPHDGAVNTAAGTEGPSIQSQMWPPRCFHQPSPSPSVRSERAFGAVCRSFTAAARPSCSARACGCPCGVRAARATAARPLLGERSTAQRPPLTPTERQTT